MSTAPIKLYADSFWISPWVFTCFVTLREKGLPFDVVDVALHEKAQRRASFVETSVTGRVPALEHADFGLAESQAIVEYLEEAFPAPAHRAVLPLGLRARARARQVMGWIRSDLGALREERSTVTMFYERATTPLSGEASAAAEKLIAVSSRLLREHKTTLFGEWSIADSDLAFMLHRLLLNGYDLPPEVRSFAATQWQRPSVREFVEHPRAAYVPY